MLIYQYEQNLYKEKETLIDALSLSLRNKEIIAFVGGGGKSSLIKKLSNELKELKKRVIITTTTHIYKPKHNVVLHENLDKIKDVLEKHCVVTVGLPSDNQKLKTFSDSFLAQLPNICDVLLIEADGSKHMPIKAPAIHEPVIPSYTTLVVGVTGLDCLGKPINEVSHRAEVLAKVLNKEQNDLLLPEDVATILESEQGQKKNVTCRYEMILNKADNPELFEKALATASFLISKKCIITSFQN